MEKFLNLKSIPSFLPLQNIDTDMIIPKQFLKTIKRTGLGKSLFYEMRYDEKLLNTINFNKMLDIMIKQIQKDFIKRYKNEYKFII